MTPASRVCTWCGTPFTTSTKRVTCGAECNRSLRTQRMRDLRERERKEATAHRPAEYPPGYFDPDAAGRDRITRAWFANRERFPSVTHAMRATAIQCGTSVAVVMSVLRST